MSCLDLSRLDMRLLHMHIQVVEMLGNLNPSLLVPIQAVSSHNMEVSQRRMVSVYKFCVSAMVLLAYALINFPESILNISSYKLTLQS